MQRLPDDIPGRDILINAGFINYAVLRNHRSIESIRGMDSKTAGQLLKYLNGESKEQKRSKNYTVSELKEMDLSGKDDSFFEGDDRKTVQDLR